MKHPSHTPPGPSPGRAAGRRPPRDSDGPRDAAGDGARADEPEDEPELEPEDAIDDQRPHDLLARELDALRSELDTLAGGAPADLDERAEIVRERYSELLDDYNDDPEALTRIRALGRRIKDLEEAGSLPRSLIRRGRSRR